MPLSARGMVGVWLVLSLLALPEMLGSDPVERASTVRSMACRGMFFALTDEQEAELMAARNDAEVRAFVHEVEMSDWVCEPLDCETDKAWDAMHRCLSDGTLGCGRRLSPLDMAAADATRSQPSACPWTHSHVELKARERFTARLRCSLLPLFAPACQQRSTNRVLTERTGSTTRRLYRRMRVLSMTGVRAGSADVEKPGGTRAPASSCWRQWARWT